MNKSLEQVKEFHNTFGAPVLSKAMIPSEDRVKLRLSLILEELSELAEASSAQNIFANLLENKLAEIKSAEKTNKNLTECLDALCDLQVVLNGSILEYGLQPKFDEAFDNVHDSNMSKTCLNELDAQKSVEKYTSQGIETHYELVGNKYVIYRSSDRKILKGVNFYTPSLEKFCVKEGQ